MNRITVFILSIRRFFQDHKKLFRIILPGVVLTLLFIDLQLVNLGKEHIKIWDEAHKAVNAYEMIHSGNYLNSTWDNKIDNLNTKPPGLIWHIVASWKIFGYSEFSVRLPGAIYTLMTLILLVLWYKRIDSNLLFGYLWALLLLLIPGINHYHVTRTADPEPILLFFTTLYLLVFYSIYVRLVRFERTSVHWVIFGFAVFAAFLVKGIAGYIPLTGIAAFTLLKWKRILLLLRCRGFWITMGVVLILTSLYYFISEIKNPGYLQAVMKYEIGLFNDPLFDNLKHPEFHFYFSYLYTEGLKYYHLIILTGLLLWPFQEKRRRRLTTYAFISLLSILLVYSASTVKNEWYIASVYPFICLVAVNGIHTLLRKTQEIVSRPLQGAIFSWSIFILLLIYMVPRSYNMAATYGKNSTNIIYPPELEGAGIREMANKQPESRNYTILGRTNAQNYFYCRLYSNLDYHIDIISSPDKISSNDTVLVCQQYLITELLEAFDVDTLSQLETGCVLFKIEGASSEKTPESR